ncbi:MAG: hypothetical protein QME70_07940 [Bacillota bacterium]|nr:hypothetical protein [Bacillota bacterium]
MGIDVVLVHPDYTVVESLVRPGKYHVEEGGWYAEGLARLRHLLQVRLPRLYRLLRALKCSVG